MKMNYEAPFGDGAVIDLLEMTIKTVETARAELLEIEQQLKGYQTAEEDAPENEVGALAQRLSTTINALTTPVAILAMYSMGEVDDGAPDAEVDGDRGEPAGSGGCVDGAGI